MNQAPGAEFTRVPAPRAICLTVDQEQRLINNGDDASDGLVIEQDAAELL